MKKQTYHIILLCISIILLCLYFGKNIIYEGNETQSSLVSTTTPPDIPDASKMLGTVTGLKDEVKIETDKAKSEAELADLAAKAAKAISGSKYNEITDLKAKILKALKDIIDSAFTKPVLFLPLTNNAKNYAKPLEINDPTNRTVETNKNISGNVTNLEYVVRENKSCVLFKDQKDQYLSFPVNVALQFSFCFWIYVEPTPHYYTAVSLTNKQYMNPSIQVDIHNNQIMIFSALPTHWSMMHIYPVQKSGWVHLVYTFTCDGRKNHARVDVYANKQRITNIRKQAPKKPIRPWEKRPPFRFFQDDPENRNLVIYTPDTFIIGRSGDNFRAYKGHIRQFIYYAMRLNQTQINDIYKYTEDG
jgi:hypothetical protein